MDKKELLYSAALEMFVSNGFHATPTAKIAEKAGVANGTLFNYFPTKDDLVKNLYLHTKDELSEFLNDTVSGISVKDCMKMQYVSTIQWSLENRVKYRYMNIFATSAYMNLLDDATKLNDESYQLIQKGMDYGLIQKLPIDFVHNLIYGHTYALHTYLSKNELSPYQKEKMIENAFDMLWRMLR
jgi:AcrR family transcriptional regulator